MFDEQTFEDILLSGLVIGNRMIALSRADGQEAAKMVAEKVDAFTDGSLAVARDCISLGWGLAARPLDAESWRRPAQTFAAPGRKTLRANAERLAGYSG
ncbi:MAG: hypothetical protein AAF511_02810 [Pseudomonadota bacterium]